MNVDSTDGLPKEVRQLKKRLPSPLMATSLLGPHERALQSTHRFRLTGYSRLDFSGNSDPETGRGRKVGGTKEGGTKEGATKRRAQKKGAWPPCYFVVWFHRPSFQQSTSPINVQGPLLLIALLLGAVPRVHHLAS